MITHTLATRYPNSAFFGDSYDMVKKIDESKLPTLVK